MKKRAKKRATPRARIVAPSPMSTNGTTPHVALTSADAIAQARQVAMILLADAQSKDITVAERGKRFKVALAAMKSLDELTGEAGSISVNKILQHPAWRKIQETIRDVLPIELQDKLSKALYAIEPS